MSIEISCTCDGLPAHSHVFRHDVVVGLNGQRRAQPVDTGEIRISVDWKAVARELAVPPPEPMVTVLQRAGSPLGLVVDPVVEQGPDDTEYWFTVRDWNGRLVYDEPGPVPPELVTLTSRDLAEGRMFTFDARPLTDEDRRA